MRILLAEDQYTLNTIITERLTKEGYAVDATRDGDEALAYLSATTYNLVILDIMMPKKDGLEVLRTMRQRGIETPVIFLTARDTVIDKVKGLDLGADDYLVKPFSYDELVARIRSILRREKNPIQALLTVGDLTLNRTTSLVQRAGNDIKLSRKEFSLLEYLMLHEGEVVSRESLERVSTNFDYEGYSNVIDVYIRFIRKKVDDPYPTKLIHTVRGFGYMIKDTL